MLHAHSSRPTPARPARRATLARGAWGLGACLLAAALANPALAQRKLSWYGTDLRGLPCSISHGISSFGPYDYTDATHRRKHLPIVERVHFAPSVENLISGVDGRMVIDDLHYTARAFPNHHRALYALVRYHLRSKRRLDNPPECWLDRALAFRPKDANVYLVYGIYLHRLKQFEAALEKYQQAEALVPQNSELLYNIGLLYFDKGDMTGAVDYAKKAYALNYPLPGLRQRLAQRGYSLSN